jgi:hypothetical protein
MSILWRDVTAGFAVEVFLLLLSAFRIRRLGLLVGRQRFFRRPGFLSVRILNRVKLKVSSFQLVGNSMAYCRMGANK